jgi:hypothetical protein
VIAIVVWWFLRRSDARVEPSGAEATAGPAVA